MVLQFTDGRSSSLRDMTEAEFNEMCDAIQERFGAGAYEQELRKHRNAVLLRIGRLGINTVDNWDEVNAFLLSPRIAGKLLYEMSLTELKDLTRKLEAIKKAGGLKSIREAEKAEQEAKAREELSRIVTIPRQTTDKPKYLS